MPPLHARQQHDPCLALAPGHRLQSNLHAGYPDKEKRREPTIEEIAKETDISEEDIIYALDAIATPMSLFEPVYQDGNDPLFLMDQICDKKNKEENWVQSLALQEAMQRLDERELNIIRLRFFEGKTQTEVADEIAISQAQVSRLEKNALKSMRHYLSNE